MKQSIDFTHETLTENEISLIRIWKKRKYNNTENTLTLGEVIELLIAYSFNLHKEESDTRFFANILINADSLIGWEGENLELIDVLFYELSQTLRKHLIYNPNLI